MLSGEEAMPDSIPWPLTKPAKMLLKRHFDRGAILVQRKSGGDLIGSLDKLNLIQSRMQMWARPGGCWLLATDIDATVDGCVIAGGHEFDRTISSVGAKLRWWEMRGGHWEILDNDDYIDPWLDRMVVALSKILDDPIKFTQENEPFIDRVPLQRLVQTDADWLTTGAAFPKGWGIKARSAVHKSLCEDGIPPTLINAIERVCVGRIKVPGVGPAMTESLRRWAGWAEEKTFPARVWAGYGKEDKDE
jgi:hypothetical protein